MVDYVGLQLYIYIYGHCICPNAEHPDGCTFGDISVILVGDFGQLEPIDDWSLCDTEARYKDQPRRLLHLWRHAEYGKELLKTFNEAVILSRIHRSSDDLWWTESCLRLRDFTCTKDGDYDWWRTHDLDHGHLTEDQKKYFEDKAVWLCARCEDVGRRNGRKLSRLAEAGKELVHRIYAQHNNKHAKKHPGTAFNGLRQVINVVRGCKIALTKNVAYLYGLANGTRGTLVGVVYPSGAKAGDFPEALVVDVPSYTGPAFYPEEPTWVPILPSTSVKDGTRMTRTQFPIVPGYAMTVNKAQGLTIEEGVVIHLAGSKRFRPASKHGLPFVAFTRSECFAMTAFKNLPPWNDFVKGKESNMLRMRSDFLTRLGYMHQRTVRKYSDMKNASDENIAFDDWNQKRSGMSAPKKASKFFQPCPQCQKLGF